MASKEMPSLEYLNSVLEIKDGLLYNKTARNSRCVKGDLAGSYSGRYALIALQGKSYLVHRIAYYMANGYCPDNVDHIDCNKRNNHIDNLRPATKSENQLNKGLSKNNKSGVKNISWSSKFNKWYASLNVNGKTKNLGYFDNLNLAKEFVELARTMAYGNFANHGATICR